MGAQMPSNAVQLAEPLEEPARNHLWLLRDEQPEQVLDYRGTVYRTDTGFEQRHSELGDLPEGLTCEPRPSFEHAWINGGWAVDPVLQALSAVSARERLRAGIDAERDRRVDAGIEFEGVMYQSRAGDRENIAGSAQLAFMAIVAGAQPGDLRWSEPEVDFFWIAADNTRVTMDAQTVVAFGKSAALNKQAHIIGGSNLKLMNPIPVDYVDDKWWPSKGKFV